MQYKEYIVNITKLRQYFTMQRIHLTLGIQGKHLNIVTLRIQDIHLNTATLRQYMQYKEYNIDNTRNTF